jgi:uncharacterized protein (DUF58 family)
MIVPANRLIGLAALISITAALLTARTPDWGVPALLAVIVLALIAVLDLLSSRSLLSTITAEVTKGTLGLAPETLRFTKGVDATLPLVLHNASARPVALRAGLQWPLGIRSECEYQSITLPAERTSVAFPWPCVPEARGTYALDHLYLETPSRLGLWHTRAQTPCTASIRVYPNTATERNRVAALFLNRSPLGVHAQRQVGRGREFEQLREYIAGDALEDIHWKATARRAHPISKTYRIERTQEVYVVLDASRFGARVVPDASDTQLELGIAAALVLAMVAEQQGDLFGLVAFSDRLDRFVRAGHGKPHFQACRDAVYTLESKPVNPDFADIFTELRIRLRRRALLIFLTHLDDPLFSEDFAQHVRVLSRLHLVVVFVMTPEGVRPLFSTPANSLEEVYQHLAGHLQWHDMAETQKQLRRVGVTMRTTSHARLTPDLLSQYMQVKKRQLL